MMLAINMHGTEIGDGMPGPSHPIRLYGNSIVT